MSKFTSALKYGIAIVSGALGYYMMMNGKPYLMSSGLLPAGEMAIFMTDSIMVGGMGLMAGGAVSVTSMLNKSGVLKNNILVTAITAGTLAAIQVHTRMTFDSEERKAFGTDLSRGINNINLERMNTLTTYKAIFPALLAFVATATAVLVGNAAIDRVKSNISEVRSDRAVSAAASGTGSASQQHVVGGATPQKGASLEVGAPLSASDREGHGGGARGPATSKRARSVGKPRAVDTAATPAPQFKDYVPLPGGGGLMSPGGHPHTVKKVVGVGGMDVGEMSSTMRGGRELRGTNLAKRL